MSPCGAGVLVLNEFGLLLEGEESRGQWAETILVQIVEKISETRSNVCVAARSRRQLPSENQVRQIDFGELEQETGERRITSKWQCRWLHKRPLLSVRSCA